MVNVENLIRLATLVRDEKSNKQNTALRVGGTLLEVVYAISYLLETVGELDTLANGLVSRTRYFHGSCSSSGVDALKNSTDLGVYVATGPGWRGLLSVQFDFHSTVSQVALSSSTPDYGEGPLVWKPVPCVMFRTYTDGAWSQWQPVSGGGDLPIQIVSDAVGDFDLSDEAGYVLLRCENGHIRTENFYSGDVYTKGEVDSMVGGGGVTQAQLSAGLATKQDKLTSGSTIKTINGVSILGSGNIEVASNHVIDVRAYGAVGDGTTDDTAALEDAFAAGFSAKKPVVFPDGTYMIRRPLTLRSGMEVYGLGNATIKKKASATTKLTASLSAGSSTMTVASVSGFAVGDYIFVSSEARIYPAARHCSVGVITSINSSTKKITFESSYKDQKAGAVKTHAVGCYVSNSCALIRSWGTKYECIGAYVHNLTLDGNRVDGEFGDWQNGCIHIDACTGTVEGIVYSKEARDNTFTNLVIRNSPFDGISDQGNGGAYIENCKIINPYMHGVHFGTFYSGALVTHNIITNTANGAACFWCQNVENLVFDGNIVDGCYKGCSDYEYGTAGQSSVISNNIFRGVVGYVFDFGHTASADFQGRMVINGNLIEDVNYIVGNFPNKSNIIFSDNIIKNYATTPSYLFNLDSASMVILSSNLAPTIAIVVSGTATGLINVNNSWN